MDSHRTASAPGVYGMTAGGLRQKPPSRTVARVLFWSGEEEDHLVPARRPPPPAKRTRGEHGAGSNESGEEVAGPPSDGRGLRERRPLVA